ncbi:MAG: cytochrome C oxidase subunit IV family protein [Sphingobacteriales bacterium]|nr:cytochrome C oxidase subunit IV family protein [Sphingobacteriales bacterium]
MSTDNTNLEHAGEHNTMSKGRILRVLLILSVITGIEFFLALAIPASVMPQHIKNIIYVLLTLVKAYYIVAFFMHLKFEKVTLIIGILISFVFIIYFIILLLADGNYMNAHMN